MKSVADVSSILSEGLRANTSRENEWLASAPPEMQAQMVAQLLMQKEQELMEQIQKVMKGKSEATKTLEQNIAG
jgi:hypothetical protein